MLRVPSWRMSAYRATSSTSPGETTSVTTLRPVSARAVAIIFNAEPPSPLYRVGRGRGLQAPPLRRLQPDLVHTAHDGVDRGLARLVRHHDDHEIIVPRSDSRSALMASAPRRYAKRMDDCGRGVL